MSMRYSQGANYSGATRFTKTPLSQVEYSRMVTDPVSFLDFNAGDIVPLKCIEVLPHSTFSIDFDFILRQTTASVRPVMGKLTYDIFAFFVPNRIINDSWRNVLGENTSGFWSAPEVELAPLVDLNDTSIPTAGVKVPVGSVADYYGFPTQGTIPKNILAQMHDLKPKGYLSIWNNYFRDENYQNPLAFSKLNVYNGFMSPVGTYQGIKGTSMPSVSVNMPVSPDGSYPEGAVAKAIFGEGIVSGSGGSSIARRMTQFSFLGKPLKANKYHDAFTSVLPAPQKGAEVVFTLADGELPVKFAATDNFVSFDDQSAVDDGYLKLQFADSIAIPSASNRNLYTTPFDSNPTKGTVMGHNDYTVPTGAYGSGVSGWNLEGKVDMSQAGVSITDLRTAIATQQVLELLARGGSRYWEFLKSFFGVEVENPFPDIPTQLGHVSRELDMYQVAQTAPSNDSPQGSLTAFGYTNKGGSLFTKTFIEHGYIHIFGIVRHKPIYSSYLAPDNFRRNTMDFYMPQFANISEQPVRLACLNPFRSDSLDLGIGFQEAWWEYRMDMDTVAGMMRSQPEGVESLDVWHYGDFFDEDFTHVNGDWLYDKTEEILNRSLSVTSELVSQFIGMFNWKITKQLPMPVYSVPGLDQI